MLCYQRIIALEHSDENIEKEAKEKMVGETTFKSLTILCI